MIGVDAARRFVVPTDEADLRLDILISRHVPSLSRAQAQRLIRDGRVRVGDGRVKPSLPIAAGATVEVDIPAPAPIAPQPEALPLTILHDDADIVVVDKPAGLVVHPGAGHRQGTLVNALLHHVSGLSGIGGHERPGIVHRLDRGTSGVMVIAKHDLAHQSLARQFQERDVRKEYVALVWGTVNAPGTIDRPIGRDPRQRQKMSSRARRPRSAITEIVSAEPLGGVSMLHLTIGTGRTHQIRVHLSENGHPVVGDATYGGVRKSLPPAFAPLLRLTRPFLHALRLTFVHPGTDATVTYAAPLAADLQAVLDALKAVRG